MSKNFDHLLIKLKNNSDLFLIEIKKNWKIILTLIVSSSSASVVVSPAAAIVGKVTIFVSRLSREEKKNELPPDASKIPEKKIVWLTLD